MRGGAGRQLHHQSSQEARLHSRCLRCGYVRCFLSTRQQAGGTACACGPAVRTTQNRRMRFTALHQPSTATMMVLQLSPPRVAPLHERCRRATALHVANTSITSLRSSCYPSSRRGQKSLYAFQSHAPHAQVRESDTHSPNSFTHTPGSHTHSPRSVRLHTHCTHTR